jgi:hypothetical protein
LDLNVIVEYHYINKNKYEVTVRTAMCKDEFKISDGQYKIEIDDDGNSVLYKNERSSLNSICDFTM